VVGVLWILVAAWLILSILIGVVRGVFCAPEDAPGAVSPAPASQGVDPAPPLDPGT